MCRKGSYYKEALREIANFDLAKAKTEAEEESKKYSDRDSISYPYVAGALEAHLFCLINKARSYFPED